MNRYTSSGVHDVTPHERYYGRKPEISHVRIFGSIAYVHIPDEKGQKLEPKSEKCILVGHSLEQKMYKFFNPSTRKVCVSWDVVFDESSSWYKPDLTPPEPSTNDLDNNEDDEQLRSILEESPTSTKLSRPQEPPSNQRTSRPSPKMDKGKAKRPKYEDDQFDGNESTYSLNSEFGGLDVPLMRSPRVKKALSSANEKLCRSTQEKNLVSRSGYNNYYAFIMKMAAVRDTNTMQE